MDAIAVIVAFAAAGLAVILIAFRRRWVGTSMAMLMLIILFAICGMAFLYPAAVMLRQPGN